MAYTISELVDKEREMGMTLGPFERYMLLEQPHVPERVRRNLLLAKKHPELVAARQGLTAMDINDVNTAAFGAINTSASELNMIGATQAIINQYCAIGANDARAGKLYELKMSGTYGNTGTPTVVFTPRWGTSTTPATNITLGANAAWTTITGTTGLPYLIEFEFAIRTSPPGATLGTGKGFGRVSLGIPLTNSQISAEILIGGTAATIDTTGQGAAPPGLTMNLTWSASSSSNTSTCELFRLRSLN